MAKTNRTALHKLPARLPSKPGQYGDGGGLALKVGPNGSRAWLFRYQRQGKAHELGLGSYPQVSLSDARAKAAELRASVKAGATPQTKVSPNPGHRSNLMTFAEAAEGFIANKEARWRNDKHRQQWTNTLKTYAFPVLGNLQVASITDTDVQKALLPIWSDKRETSNRTLARIIRIIDWCDDHEDRQRDNPAAKAKRLMPDRSPRKVKHRPSIPWSDMPAFMAKLRERDGVAARALEFQILAGARPGEVRKADWNEIDGNVWILPAEKYKTDRPHVVPLTDQAMALLTDTAKGPLFPKLHENSQQNVLYAMGYAGSDATAHGFRSTLRTWCADYGVPREVAEGLLGHTLGKVERAYNRADQEAAKRQVLEQWAEFLAGTGEGQEAA